MNNTYKILNKSTIRELQGLTYRTLQNSNDSIEFNVKFKLYVPNKTYGIKILTYKTYKKKVII